MFPPSQISTAPMPVYAAPHPSAERQPADSRITPSTTSIDRTARPRINPTRDRPRAIVSLFCGIDAGSAAAGALTRRPPAWRSLARLPRHDEQEEPVEQLGDHRARV